MNKIDYNKLMEEEISNLKYTPKLLLHACCAPCSSSVIERLMDFFDITVFFYNPNIDNFEEFEKRKEELIRFIFEFNKDYNKNIKYIIIDYDSDEYLKQVKGLEKSREGGSRCLKCFNLRLEKTYEYAIKNNFEYFTTTLSVSPYKNSEILNKIGLSFKNDKVKYLVSDFKKRDGYKRSIELSKTYNLYRQNYCGCEFSKF